MASFEDSAILLPLRLGSEPVIPSLFTNNLIAISDSKVAFAFDRFIYTVDTNDKQSPLQVACSSCADAAFGLHRLSMPERGSGSNVFIVALGAAWIQVIETEEMQNAFSYKIPAANARPGIVHFAQSMCLLSPGVLIPKHRFALRCLCRRTFHCTLTCRRRMIIGMSDGSLISFLVEGFKFEVSVTQKLQTAPVSALLVCSPSPSDSFYAGTLDGDVILYKEDADGKFKADQQRNLMGNPVSCMVSCPVGIAVSLTNGQISLLNALTLHPLLDVAAHARSIYAMSSLDGGRKLLTTGLDTAIHVWTFSESSGQPAEMFLSQTLHLPKWCALSRSFLMYADASCGVCF